MNMQQKLGSVIGPSVAGVTLAVGGPALCYAADGRLPGAWVCG
jgi:hypothetical protein